jgi:predicted TIM-barrel fold metal-dependent hydrolase
MTLTDVHSHLYPPVYLDLLRVRDRFPRVATVDGEDRFIIFPEEDDPVSPGGRAIGDSFWSVEAKLAFMDDHGISRTVLSVGNPWLDPFRGPESLAQAAAVNEEMGSLEERTGGRIAGLGVLPNATVEDAASVVRSIAGNPLLRGIVTGPRVCDRTLDDEELEPLWEALDDTRLPWLLHPSDGAALSDIEGFGHSLPIALGFPFETTIAVTRFVFAGVLERHPQIRLVASHGGGTLPFLAARLDAAWRSDAAAQKRLTTPPSTSLARLHLDAVTYHGRALSAASDLAGGKLAFGTDHPFPVADVEANITAIDDTFAEAADRDRVRSGHAEQLFELPPHHHVM